MYKKVLPQNAHRDYVAHVHSSVSIFLHVFAVYHATVRCECVLHTITFKHWKKPVYHVRHNIFKLSEMYHEYNTESIF